MKRFKPDFVMHFAGLKSVSESAEDPLRYFEVNVGGSINLLQVMQTNGCNQIVFSSSATVYDDAIDPPYSEQHPIKPSSIYGKTKLMFEQILKEWVQSCTDNRAICLRYFNPVGADSSGLVGEDPSGIPNNLMPFIAQVAAGRRQRLSIFGSDYATRDGTGERDFIHVSDLAFAHVRALEKIKSLDKFEIINIGTGKGTTVKEHKSLRAIDHGIY